ncbi:reverse transcriptase domain-containing protein, partial [Tanacetum coccineum]
IQYRPRTSIKGQILADFIVERLEDDPLDTPMEAEEELPDPWRVFTDGSSCIDGSRAAGQRIAEQMGVKNLQTNVDSHLVANQVPRSENKKANALNKIASTSFAHLTKQVLVEELKEKSINEAKVLAVVEEDGDTWMTPIYNYLTEETLPAEKEKAIVVRRKSGSMHAGTRYVVAKHPQANSLVERANRSFGEGIKVPLDERSKDWIEELPHVLWAHCTMIKSSNGDTPFSLTYGTEAVIPAEIGMLTMRTAEVDIV